MSLYQINLVSILLFFLEKNFNFINVVYDPTGILESMEFSIISAMEEEAAKFN